MSDKVSSVHYINYLSLDKFIRLSTSISGESERFIAHEEMLFIIIHQTYELWFKQIIHELDSIMNLFSKDRIDEMSLGIVVRELIGLTRYCQPNCQLDILETMTSLDFLDFRNFLPFQDFNLINFEK